VLAEVAQVEVVRDEVASRLREQHLASVRGAHDPGRTVDVHADVALVRHLRLARVQSHPHAHPTICERALRLLCSRGPIVRALERNEERVALRVDLDAVVAPERLPQQPTMVRQDVDVAVTELLEESRRALDVGEEQRDGSGRQLAHADRISRWRAGV
jgi:hypothetical protein